MVKNQADYDPRKSQKTEKTCYAAKIWLIHTGKN